jgi:AcrR family transcriptional regulator
MNFYKLKLIRKETGMKEDKTNRKVRYTKRVLKESLIKPMKQKPITRITITELCEEADINRATFYAHYTDQYDLLKQIEQELVDDINQYLEDYKFNEYGLESMQRMEQIFEYIRENSEVCSVLISDSGDKEFLKEVLLIVQQQCIAEWTSKNVNKDVAEYLYAYATSGSIGIIQKWLQEGMTRSTREMAEIITKLTDQGLSAFT